MGRGFLQLTPRKDLTGSETSYQYVFSAKQSARSDNGLPEATTVATALAPAAANSWLLHSTGTKRYAHVHQTPPSA